MVRSNRSEHSADSRSSRRSSDSSGSTITIKSIDTRIPKPSRRNKALGAMIYFAGGNPNRVRAVRHNEVRTEWDDDRYSTMHHQMYFVSAKHDWYSGWGYDDYEPAPRRSASRRSNPIPVHHHHPGGPGPGPIHMNGPPPGPTMMPRDDDCSSSSSDDDGSWSGDSVDDYGMPPPPHHMHMGGPDYSDMPFPGGPHPDMMPPHMGGMHHPQEHFAGPPPPPPPPGMGGDMPAFIKINRN